MSAPKLSWESYMREQQLGNSNQPPPPCGPTHVVEKDTTCINKVIEPTRPTEAPNTTESLIKNIEKCGEEFVIKNKNLTSEILINHMQQGADEFKQKTGRNMTYSEIRSAWG